ncbi:hypothetical protein ACIBLA_05025 [Streptomyces sp. NPDC050433]|uniref:hypothetical protein n=1 Tax=Streptomyces sp. NPDC050433 TaxID=3365615 RepID=UPI0037AC721D
MYGTSDIRIAPASRVRVVGRPGIYSDTRLTARQAVQTLTIPVECGDTVVVDKTVAGTN